MTDAPPKLRVLIASHGHPKIAKGGAEIAAWQLYQELLQQPGCEAWFLGCEAVAQEPHARITQPFTDREYLYSGQNFDWFRFSNPDPLFPEAFITLLHELQPNVIHFHHYGRFGIEVFHIARRALPKVRIVLTLHEYLAICHHFGQMVTRPHLNLCYESSPLNCNRCFPDIKRESFFLRNFYLQRYLAEVDQFISPSFFLRERYVAWGLDPTRISVIDNVMAPVRTGLSSAPRPTNQLKAAFFGDGSPFAGNSILFEAAHLLEMSNISNIMIDAFDDSLNSNPTSKKLNFSDIHTSQKFIRRAGYYDICNINSLIQHYDLIIMPSLCWENSPLVIQEARRSRKPVICSDIGGMAEKVRDTIDGYHFSRGSPRDLAFVMTSLAADLSRDSFIVDVSPNETSSVENAPHLPMYKRLCDT